MYYDIIKKLNEEQKKKAEKYSYMFCTDFSYTFYRDKNGMYLKHDSGTNSQDIVFRIETILDIFNFYYNTYRYISNISKLKNIVLPIIIRRDLGNYIYLLSGKFNTDKIIYKKVDNIENYLAKMLLLGINYVGNIDNVLLMYVEKDSFVIVYDLPLIITEDAKYYLGKLEEIYV